MARVEKTRCGGRWSESRFRQFIVTSLRQAAMKWGPKHDCISACFTRNGINPKTGRKCKLHRCELCGREVPKKDMRADHIEPVVDPNQGFVSWDEYIKRMFCEREGLQGICVTCHDKKSEREKNIRTGVRRIEKSGRVRRRKKKRLHDRAKY